MMPSHKRKVVVLFLVTCILYFYTKSRPLPLRTPEEALPPTEVHQAEETTTSHAIPIPTTLPADDDRLHWAKVSQRYPVPSMIPIPTAVPHSIPAIQYDFPAESADTRRVRLARLEAVRGNFTHAWNGYKAHAWMSDEVGPLSGKGREPFGGWAATLVDSLGTLRAILARKHSVAQTWY